MTALREQPFACSKGHLIAPILCGIKKSIKFTQRVPCSHQQIDGSREWESEARAQKQYGAEKELSRPDKDS